ncbi:unnamed protein product [Orchesella dallaii]|uniref:Carbonic anhydrase n=1 Tax=Orchesella dallaii TaxID=48710 RepID=A0ABP1PJP3_9HEXA
MGVFFRNLIPETICDIGDDKCLCLSFYLIQILRLFVSVVSITQSCQFFALTCTIVGLAIEGIFTSMKMVYFITRSNEDVNMVFKYYKACHILTQVFHSFCAPVAAIFMAMGFNLVVCCTVAAIRTAGTVTLRLYWLFPFVDVVVLVIIYGFLPFASELHEKSVVILYHLNWKTLELRKKSAVEFRIARRIINLLIIFLQFGSLYGNHHESVFVGITDPEATWCYQDAECGEATWPELCSTGKAQSPIDLPAIKKTSCTIKNFPRESYESRHFILESNKRTVGVKLLDTEPSFEWKEHHGSYLLHSLQFHWGSNYSTGSEHTINSKQFALEMHLIHYRDDFNSIEEAINSEIKNSLAIIAVLFEADPNLEKNEDLQPILKYLPGVYYPEAINSVRDKLSLGKFMQGSEAYTYQGSLTSPSCAEQVAWLVWKKPNRISISDLDSFRMVTNAKEESIRNQFRKLEVVKFDYARLNSISKSSPDTPD